MPEGMALEVQKITSGAGQAAHLDMIAWADKSESKSILGQTLSADSGGKGQGGSFALGKVHNEVRHDIRKGDARQVNGTLTRDLVYPMWALNRPGIKGLKRCPRFKLDVSEPEDITAFAENLPKLAKSGFRIAVDWAHSKVNIPMAKDGEAILVAEVSPEVKPDQVDKPAQAALSAQINEDPEDQDADALSVCAAPAIDSMIAQLKAQVDAATSMAALQANLVNAYGGQPVEALTKIMAAAFALAELKGLSDVLDGQ
jgi:phage gp29-like protein